MANYFQHIKSWASQNRLRWTAFVMVFYGLVRFILWLPPLSLHTGILGFILGSLLFSYWSYGSAKASERKRQETLQEELNR